MIPSNFKINCSYLKEMAFLRPCKVELSLPSFANIYITFCFETEIHNIRGISGPKSFLGSDKQALARKLFTRRAGDGLLVKKLN